MAKILTGGVGRTEVARTLGGLGIPGLDVAVCNDMEAAALLRAGRADFFLGTCHTGAGASLGVLVGLLGRPACHTFGRGEPTDEEVADLLARGKTVFGFSTDRIDTVAPRLARAIAARA
ncbi:DUF2620 family protein [Streptomyces antimicrobicus]|uniref:DUF2620 domain-containing protein n=1 Tax=Streptomyces antimicrobicus TaxID=2883108 RepID=A0ABS8BCL2_9ACTN|nr:DUF2620 family protein [Streptomyces antimicrobicus]MCB5182374.1 DUF2620 domain-containing protein [Streptomyces antimicrobicus]